MALTTRLRRKTTDLDLWAALYRFATLCLLEALCMCSLHSCALLCMPKLSVLWIQSQVGKQDVQPHHWGGGEFSCWRDIMCEDSRAGAAASQESKDACMAEGSS